MNREKVKTSFRDDVVYGYRCSMCGFVLDGSLGGYLYVKNNYGVRVPLKDNNERETVARLLLSEDGLFDTENSHGFHGIIDIMEEKMGYMSACVCMHCLDQFGLDLRKDAIECPHCKSDHVRTFLEMTNKRCPKCQSGYMDKKGDR